MTEASLERVLKIWQDVVGHTLSPERRRAFLSRPETAALAIRKTELLELTAQRVMSRDSGVLRLASWKEAVLRLAEPAGARALGAQQPTGAATSTRAATVAVAVPVPPAKSPPAKVGPSQSAGATRARSLSKRSGDKRPRTPAGGEALDGPAMRGAPRDTETHRRISQMLDEVEPYN